MENLVDQKSLSAISTYAAAFFMVAVIALIWRYTPDIMQTMKERAQADVKLAQALTGLTDQLNGNRQSCLDAQQDYKDAVVALEKRMEKKLVEMQSIEVLTLRNVEAICTTLKVRGELENG